MSVYAHLYGTTKQNMYVYLNDSSTLDAYAPNVKRFKVEGKKEARQLAAKAAAIPWNF